MCFSERSGGTVVIGVTNEGKIVGKEVSDKTRREIAAMLDCFEPPTFEEQDGAVYVTFKAQIGPE